MTATYKESRKNRNLNDFIDEESEEVVIFEDEPI